MQKQLAGRSLGRTQHRVGVLLFLTLSAAVLGCGGDSGDRGADDDDDRDARASAKPQDAGSKKDSGTSTNRTLGGRLGTGAAAAPCSADLPCNDASASGDAGVASSSDGGASQSSEGGSGAGSKDGGGVGSSDGGGSSASDGGATSPPDAGTPPRDGGGGSSDASTPAPDASTPAPDASSPAPTCRTDADDDACDLCLKGKCCAELNTCAADTSCLNLASCVDTCFDLYCVETCESLYPRAVDKYYDYSDCAETSCLAACSTAGG